MHRGHESCHRDVDVEGKGKYGRQRSTVLLDLNQRPEEVRGDVVRVDSSRDITPLPDREIDLGGQNF